MARTLRRNKKTEFEKFYNHFTGKGFVDKKTKPVEKSGKKEAEVLADCKKYLISVGINPQRNNTGFGCMSGNGKSYSYGIKHAGDLICNVGGRYVEIECKHGNGGTWSMDQQRHADEVRRKGGWYFVVHSAEELRLKIEPFLDVVDFDSL